MIRYSSYAATNYRPPSAQVYLDPLEAEYRKLLELRERVKQAEAAQRTRRNTPRVRHGWPRANNG